MPELFSFMTYQPMREQIRMERWDDWTQLTARWDDPTLCRDLFELGARTAWALRGVE